MSSTHIPILQKQDENYKNLDFVNHYGLCIMSFVISSVVAIVLIAAYEETKCTMLLFLSFIFAVAMFIWFIVFFIVSLLYGTALITKENEGEGEKTSYLNPLLKV